MHPADAWGTFKLMNRRHATSSPLKLSVFACALVAFGLLLWARFLLVTGHPRTAIADPPQAHPVAVPGNANLNH